MDNNKIQNQELDQVTGGNVEPDLILPNCPNCRVKYDRNQDYPDGFLLRIEYHGCSSHTFCYKCPSCGYEWKD